MEALFGLLGVLIGSSISYFISHKERKTKTELASQERKEKFKLVAVEKRLEAHQQVFIRWHNLLSVIHKPDDDDVKIKTINECSEFWKNNALYLEERTREGFRKAINIVSFYKTNLEIARDETDKSAKEKAKKVYIDDWNYYMNLFNIIQKEVELEPIKPDEDKTPEGEKIKKEIKKKN